MENGTPLYFCFFIITSAIGTINSAIFFVWLLEPRWKWWKTAGILFLSFFIPGMILLPFREIILIKSPILLAVTVAAVTFCFKDKFWQKALCVTIYLVSGLIIEMGGSTVCNLVIGKPYVWEFISAGDWLFYIFINVCIQLTVYAIIILLYRRRNFKDVMPQKGIVSIVLFLTGQITLSLFVIAVTYQYKLYSVGIVILCILINVISGGLGIWMVYRNIQMLRNEAELETVRRQLDMQETYTGQIRSQYETVRRLKHDFNNHLKTLSGLSRQHNYDELDKYLNALSEEISLLDKATFCMRPAVDAVLYHIDQTAIQAGIKTEFQVFEIEKLTAPDIKLCSILFNLLSNALEACAKVDGEKYINLKTGIKAGNYIISVENTSLPPAHGFESVKIDRVNHGLGLKIVSDLVTGMGGMSEFSYENGLFNSVVCLPWYNGSASL